LIFSVINKVFFKELIFGFPPLVAQQLSICFITMLKALLINGCSQQITIINMMCPIYIDLFIEFLNNLEIILIKLSPIIKYGIGTLIYSSSLQDIYNDSKIYYYLLNNPEFIDDIEYPENTVFIVNKNNYPEKFVDSITDAINGARQANSIGNETDDSTHKIIPSNVKKLIFIKRITVFDETEDVLDEAEVVLDEFRINDINDGEYIYLNPIYTRFYINIGYLTVSYISDDEARNEINRLLKNKEEMAKILKLLEIKYNVPESAMRSLSNSIGYGYRTSLIENSKGKSPAKGGFRNKKNKIRKTKKLDLLDLLLR
jgi:hypothetical protein